MSRRIAVVQMNSTSSIEQNLRQASDLIAQARLTGAQFVCLPEAFDYLVDDPSHALSLATTQHSNPLLQRYHNMASQSDLWLSLGGMYVQNPHDTMRLYKMHFILSPHDISTPVTAYRQTHLAHADPTDHVTDAGSKLAIAYDTPVGNVGVSIGHDLHFASVYTALRDANAHVLLMPSARAASEPAVHWHTLVRARAIENQCYGVAAAQVGVHTPSRESLGHSVVIGPYGDTVVDAGREGVGLACADIDLDFLHQVRERMPLRKQRRDDVLGKVVAAGPH